MQLQSFSKEPSKNLYTAFKCTPCTKESPKNHLRYVYCVVPETSLKPPSAADIGCYIAIALLCKNNIAVEVKDLKINYY